MNSNRRLRAAVAAGSMLLAGIVLAAIQPAGANTITKKDKKNTFAASQSQGVKLYGVPTVTRSSSTSSYTLRAYDSFPPTSLIGGNQTLAVFKFLTAGLAINTNEYGSSTVSSAATLSLADWAWYSGADPLTSTRLGSVGGPSLYTARGPSSSDGVLGPFDWVSMEITFANTEKPRRILDGGYVEDADHERRPDIVISFLDFGAGIVREDNPDPLATEALLSRMATGGQNPNSQGPIGPPDGLVRNCDQDPPNERWVELNRGESCADETHTTKFYPVLVRPPNDPSTIPSPAQPVTALALRSTPGRDGINPLDPSSPKPPIIQSEHDWLTQVTLTPGASLTVLVRLLVGAVHLEDDVGFRPLFVGRMRERFLAFDTEDAFYVVVADYPRNVFVNRGGPAPPPPPPDPLPPSTPTPPGLALTGPQDSQYWAQLVRLYNRSLRTVRHSSPGVDAVLRSGDF